MTTVFKSRTLSVSIDSHPGKVYGFVSDPENLPRWATAFCNSVRKSNAEWIVDTPQGPMKGRFVEKIEFGVVDHYVNPAPGVEVHSRARSIERFWQRGNLHRISFA